jgi:hypothetical protein
LWWERSVNALTAKDIATERSCVTGRMALSLDDVDLELDYFELALALTRNAIAFQRRHQLVLDGFVYFGMLDDGSIKIGYSTRPLLRLAEHARGDLRLKPILVIPGTPNLERRLHGMCRHYGGPKWEVFRNTIALMLFIRWLREGLAT